MASTASKVPEWLQSDLFLDVLQSNVAVNIEVELEGISCV